MGIYKYKKRISCNYQGYPLCDYIFLNKFIINPLMIYKYPQLKYLARVLCRLLEMT